MKRWLSYLLAVLLCFAPCLTLFGCSFGEKEYSVSYDISERPVNLDPQTASSSASLLVIHSIFEGLYTVNSDGVPQPAIAAGCEISTDGLTYTITLRDDASWSYRDAGGRQRERPVTANDFVFAFRRLLRPDTNSPGADRYICIKNAASVRDGNLSEDRLGVTAEGADRIRFDLDVRNDNFLNLLASSYAMPCNEDFFNETKGKYGLDTGTIMANGPFRLTDWSETAVCMARNDFYYAADEVLPDGVIFPVRDGIGEAETSSIVRLDEGYIDAALIDGGLLSQLKGKGFNTESIQDTVWGLYLNQKNPSLANTNIRLALRFAFDRSAYQTALPDNLQPAAVIVPPDVSLYGQNYREFAGENITQQYDAARAYEYYKAGLAELGLQNISGLHLLVNRDSGVASVDYFLRVSQILQKELSLFINIDEVDEEEFEKRIRTGDFDIALYRLQASDNTPWSVLSGFMSTNSSNFISYQNPALDEILAGISSRSDRQEALEGYASAERLILEEAVFIPMYYGTDYFVTASNAKGIVYNRQTGLVDFRSAVIS